MTNHPGRAVHGLCADNFLPQPGSDIAVCVDQQNAQNTSRHSVDHLALSALQVLEKQEGEQTVGQRQALIAVRNEVIKEHSVQLYADPGAYRNTCYRSCHRQHRQPAPKLCSAKDLLGIKPDIGRNEIQHHIPGNIVHCHRHGGHRSQNRIHKQRQGNQPGEVIK